MLKELERQMNQLSAFSTRPGVDSARLRVLLTKLHRMREELSTVGALFMQKLRDSEFLNAIKHRSTIPGGTCEFDLPDYTHWLNQPDEIRGADFANWLAVIRPLGDAISELLWMTREQGKTRREVARQRRLPRDARARRAGAADPHRCCRRAPTSTRRSAAATTASASASSPGRTPARTPCR